MGLLTEVITDTRSAFERNAADFPLIDRFIEGRPALKDGKYRTYAREGYMTNALVYACIEELASSASEPQLQAKQSDRWHHFGDSATSANRLLDLFYGPKRVLDYTADGVNPFMDAYQFWANVIMHRELSGNAYALKVRSQSGRVVELWLLRPDRVSIVPDAQHFIRHYEYNIGAQEPVRLPVRDVIHWKKKHPLDDFYGLSTLAAAAGNIDLDNYMRDFARTYFERQGVPSGILSTKAKMTDELIADIRARFSANYGGQAGWHGLLVLDAESSYTQLTQSLGAQGLVLPELNQISEARIAGAFGVPLSLVGTVVGTEASSYGNKKSEREGFWNETLKPLYKELVGPLNRSLVPEFPGVQEVSFDLSTVGALMTDDDVLHARVRADVAAGLMSLEEGRDAVGYTPQPPAGHTFYVPGSVTQTPSEKIGEEPEPPAAPEIPDGSKEEGE